MSIATALLLLATFLLGALVMNLVAGWAIGRVLKDVTEAYREEMERSGRHTEAMDRLTQLLRVLTNQGDNR